MKEGSRGQSQRVSPRVSPRSPGKRNRSKLKGENTERSRASAASYQRKNVSLKYGFINNSKSSVPEMITKIQRSKRIYSKPPI